MSSSDSLDDTNAGKIKLDKEVDGVIMRAVEKDFVAVGPGLPSGFTTKQVPLCEDGQANMYTMLVQEGTTSAVDSEFSCSLSSSGESCDSDLTVCRDMGTTTLEDLSPGDIEWRCGNSQNLFYKHAGSSVNLYNSTTVGDGYCFGDLEGDPEDPPDPDYPFNSSEGEHAYNRSDDGGYTKGSAVMVVTDVECERKVGADGYTYRTWLNVGHRELRFDSCGHLLGISRRVVSSSEQHENTYSTGCYLEESTDA